MARVIVTLQVNAASPDANLEEIKEFCKKEVSAFGAEIGKIEEQPLAFGLKAMVLHIIFEEEKGGTEELEKKISEHKDVASVQVTKVTRALG